MTRPTAAFLLLVACVPGAGGDAGALEVDAGRDAGVGLSCHAPMAIDLAAADAGRALLLEEGLGGRFVPRAALENLWLVWGVNRPADLWAAFRERYGFVEAPYANQGLPMGLQMVDSTWTTVSCLVCHGGRVAGQSVIGAPNNQVDLELLLDDLRLLAQRLGQPAPAVHVRTGARGVSDIMGFTLELTQNYVSSPPGLHTDFGFQDPPPWWSVRTKSRMYTDGSASTEAHRSMMATLLAFGYSLDDVAAREPRYVQLREYLLTTPSPVWPFAPPDQSMAMRGKALFRASCASCHGEPDCERNTSVVAQVGTDPLRAANYGVNEVAYVNANWFGMDEPHLATGGYLAPSLHGVWASAPYFHNGSVPTVAQVLDSTTRPTVFRVLGTDGASYDVERIGLQVEALNDVPPAVSRAARARYYDTRVPGLAATGHSFGDTLTSSERADLLDFLKTF